jgi:5-(carboxyamino)imidazole ribonucleotide synthase
MILPGATLGMLGGGQLGSMFTVAARTMGYDVVVLDPDPDSPAGKRATDHVCADYQDPAALDYLAKTCAAVSTEFENVPAATLEALASRCIVRPGPRAVAITQDRIHEKAFLREHGFPTAPFAVVRAEADLEVAASIGFPAILKVSRFGYDGKGQIRVDARSELLAAWESMNREAVVMEALLDLKTEVSVVIARGVDGKVAPYPAAENQHRNGILDVSIVPARVPEAVKIEAVAMAQRIAEKLEYAGVMAVEYFVLADDRLVVNEIAPRPHNSGHFTLDACVTSQFEQQVRTLCALPLGDTRLLSPVVMVNLLGDLWGATHPAWQQLLVHPNVKLHLYGKRAARPGRKMGHYSVLSSRLEDALELALRVKRDLAASPAAER